MSEKSEGADVTAVSERIRGAYDGLSPQLRQAARFILDNPEDLALQSMRQLAEHAGVNPSTMVRLARALGYGGFDELRAPYRHWLRGRTEYAARARRLRRRGDNSAGADRVLRDVIRADMAALHETVGRVPAETVAAFRQSLLGARQVYVLGLRSSFAVAYYFHYAYRMLRGNALLVTGVGGTLFDGLRGIGAGDVLLSFSVRPYTRETVLAVEFAAREGATVLAVTDSMASPVARSAQHALTVLAESPSLFQSLVPALSMAQGLLAVLVAGADEAALATISENERQLAGLEAYWRDNGE